MPKTKNEDKGIIVGDYMICSDSYCYMLKKANIHQKTKEKYYIVIGYFNTLKNVLKKLLEVVTREHLSNIDELYSTYEIMLNEIEKIKEHGRS